MRTNHETIVFHARTRSDLSARVDCCLVSRLAGTGTNEDRPDFPGSPNPECELQQRAFCAFGIFSKRYIWAVGQSTIHFDGTTWRAFPAPMIKGRQQQLSAGGSCYFSDFGLGGGNVSDGALAPNDVWAVGFSTPIAPPRHAATLTLIEHFDGTSWAVVPSPNVGPNSTTQSNRLLGLDGEFGK